jgi:hypothetical protein
METDLPLVCFTFLVRTHKDVISVVSFHALGYLLSKPYEYTLVVRNYWPCALSSFHLVIPTRCALSYSYSPFYHTCFFSVSHNSYSLFLVPYISYISHCSRVLLFLSNRECENCENCEKCEI